MGHIGEFPCRISLEREHVMKASIYTSIAAFAFAWINFGHERPCLPWRGGEPIVDG